MADLFRTDRREFLKRTGLAMGLGVGDSLGATKPHGVAIVISPDDPIASAPPAKWALKELEQSLTAHGIPVPPRGHAAGRRRGFDYRRRRLVFSTYRVHTNLAELTIDPKAGLSSSKWLTGDAARNESAPAYSPDGKRIAYFTNRKGAENEAIWVMGADGSNPVQVVEDERVNVFPRWAGDRQSLVYGSRPRALLEGDLEVRRVALSGQPPEKLPPTTAVYSLDIARDGRLVFHSEGKVQVFDLGTKQTRVLEGVRGVLHRWSADGRRIAYVISPSRQDDPEAGLWVYDFERQPRRVFGGWVPSYAWAGGDELFVVEGKPDLKGWLRLDGTPPQRIPGSVQLNFGYELLVPELRFDVHPDRRRIVIAAPELHEANIGMIENIR